MSTVCLKHTFLSFKDEPDSPTVCRRQRSRSQDVLSSANFELRSSQAKAEECENDEVDWSSFLLARYTEVLQNPGSPMTSPALGPTPAFGTRKLKRHGIKPVFSCPAISSLVEQDVVEDSTENVPPCQIPQPATQKQFRDESLEGDSSNSVCSWSRQTTPRSSSKFSLGPDEIIPSSSGDVVDDSKMVMDVKEHCVPTAPYTRPPGTFIPSVSSCPALSSLVEEDSSSCMSDDEVEDQTVTDIKERYSPATRNGPRWCDIKDEHDEEHSPMRRRRSRSLDKSISFELRSWQAEAERDKDGGEGARKFPVQRIKLVSSCPAVSSLVEEKTTENAASDWASKSHKQIIRQDSVCSWSTQATTQLSPGDSQGDNQLYISTPECSPRQRVPDIRKEFSPNFPTSQSYVADESKMVKGIKELHMPRSAPFSQPPGKFVHSVSSCPAISSLVEEDISSSDDEEDTDIQHFVPVAPCSRPPGRFIPLSQSCTAISSLVGSSLAEEDSSSCGTDEDAVVTPRMGQDAQHSMPPACSMPLSRPPGRFIHAVSSCPANMSSLGVIERGSTQNVSSYHASTSVVGPCAPQCVPATQQRGRPRAENDYMRPREDALSPPSPIDRSKFASNPLPLAQGNCAPSYKPGHFLHKHIPKSKNLAEEYGNRSDSAQQITTLMIRNIPNQYSQRDLIEEMDKLGFAGTYDFLYLPMDNGTFANVGYAFVNFLDASWAERGMDVFKNYRFKRYHKSGKIGTVSVAHIQGLENNLKHYESTSVKNARSGHRPMVMPNIQRALQA